MDAEDRIKVNYAILRDFVVEQAASEKMPKQGVKALKAALNLGEQLLLDIHRIARNGDGSP